MSGATSAGVFNPLDTLRIRWQLSAAAAESSIVSYAYRVVADEGFVAGLWRPGVLASMLSIGTSTGIRIGMYPYLRDMISADPKRKTAGVMFGAGLFAGGIGYWLACPFFQVKTQMQASLLQPGRGGGTSGVLASLQEIWSSGGAPALYRGSSPLVVRGAFFTAGQTLGYDGTKTALSQRTSMMQDGPALHLLGSVAAAFFATGFSAPADFILTKYQAAPQMGTNYEGPVDCMKQAVRNEGMQALFRGWLPNFARMAPASLLFHPLYEQFRVLMGLSYLK
eukprot:gnl/TRDRNA2_/TRDRNA2_60493_c0_seq1.p1 gnl/TRDRNA2_/TRDRNA2_60493_c0~~gnl/TRDRNA2_/TRDRNA2_60493_c0_seq1.p1  ORF type:complete len:292 (+),score=38.62 gnl/TRDRNA2_/TRDRNA2_60493_c0_seq1:39-878(+)